MTLLLGSNKQLLNKLKKRLMDRFEMTDMGDVSRVLGMNVVRDRKNEKITINQKDYTEDIVERFGMKGCNSAFTTGAGPECSLNQAENNLLDEEGKRRYQSIVGASMYLTQVSRYDILYAVNQLERGVSKPSKAHMAAAKHLLCYLAGSINLFITYKQGGFTLAAFSDSNWGNNPDCDKSTSLYIVMLANGPIS